MEAEERFVKAAKIRTALIPKSIKGNATFESVLESLKELEKHEDIPISLSLSTPLNLQTLDTLYHIGARRGWISMFQFGYGFENRRNADGKTPLHEASSSKQSEIVKILLKSSDCDVDALKRSDWTPLMTAVTKPDNLDVIKALVDAGADLLRTNKDGWNAFHLAVRDGDKDTVLYLLRSSPKSWKNVSKNGRTPLHTSALHGHLEISKLLANLCEFEAEDSTGSTPIMETIKGNHFEVLKSLVYDDLLDIHITDRMGRNYLMIAAQFGRLEILKYLVHLGGPEHLSRCTEKDKLTAAHWAASEGQDSILRYLTNLGIDLGVYDAKGRTPLHLACLGSKCESILIIVSSNPLNLQENVNQIIQDQALTEKVQTILQKVSMSF